MQAAGVLRALVSSRIGFLGHTYPGMLDMYSDFTMHHAQLGTHIEVLEMDDLHVRVEAATDDEIAAKIDEIRSVFDIAAAGQRQDLAAGDGGSPALVGAGGRGAGPAGRATSPSTG